jgi:hypothetical protein
MGAGIFSPLPISRLGQGERPAKPGPSFGDALARLARDDEMRDRFAAAEACRDRVEES